MKNLKLKISENFSRAAHNYNNDALMQKNIAENLVEQARGYISHSARILDLGSGTGFVAQSLPQQIMQSDIAMGMCRESAKISPTICADMENLPFGKNNFDAVFSSSAIQWLNIEKVFAETNRVLGQKGYFFFTTFGEQTLFELKDSYTNAGIDTKIMQFYNIDEIKNSLQKNQLDLLSVNIEKISYDFDSVKELLRSITNIGAGTSFSDENSLTRENLIALEKAYKEKYSKQSKITATWEVLYFICKKYS